jgi:hypothetical protein
MHAPDAAPAHAPSSGRPRPTAPNAFPTFFRKTAP